MKRILIFLFFSTFLLIQIGCEKAPDSPITPDNNQGTENGFSKESLYEIPGIPPTAPVCGPLTTDILICPSENDWYGKNSMKIGTMTVTDDCSNLIFTFNITEPGYFITNAVGDAWVHTPVDGRIVPPGVRNVNGTWPVTDYKISVTLTMPKNFSYYVGPVLKDLSFKAGDILGTAGYVKICTKEGFQLPLALPSTTTINYVHPNPNNPGSPLSYLNVDTDDPTLGVDNKGWCVDLGGNTFDNQNIVCNVYSSLLPIPNGVLVHPENMCKVNWILNTFSIGQVLGSNRPPLTYKDIQVAIWKEIDGGSIPSSILPYDAGNVNIIRAQAASYQNANGCFVPGCDQVFGIILDPVHTNPPNSNELKDSQTIIIEHPVKCTLGEGCFDGCAFGNRRYCADLPGFPGGFWHWVNIGYIFCCPD